MVISTRSVKTVGKIMVIVVWDEKDAILVNSLPKGKQHTMTNILKQ
jgi:hypothetical protein